MDGYKSLKAGQQVLFEVQFGEKGVHAAHIRPLEPATAPAAVARAVIAPTPARMAFSPMLVAAGEQEMQRQAQGTG
jgi:hypothetical protein